MRAEREVILSGGAYDSPKLLMLSGIGRPEELELLQIETVVECPEKKMLDAIGPTLVCSAITCDPGFRRGLVDAVHIDRLNLGPVPTTQLNWLQPHEGNLIEFLFRARAFQTANL